MFAGRLTMISSTGLSSYEVQDFKPVLMEQYVLVWRMHKYTYFHVSVFFMLISGG